MPQQYNTVHIFGYGETQIIGEAVLRVVGIATPQADVILLRVVCLKT